MSVDNLLAYFAVNLVVNFISISHPTISFVSFLKLETKSD